MISNVKLSIIIPVYNVEPYLNKCIDSVVKQTLKDIEILCIDDGSTDNSLSILEEFREKDSRVKIIKLESNKGPGFARNLGMKYARGEYFTFLDSDDWIDKNAYEQLYFYSKKFDLDMVMFRLINYEEETKKIYETPYFNIVSLNDYQYKIFNYKDIPNMFSIISGPCNKIYKTSLIKKADIKFPEEYSMFEDNPFFFDALLTSKKISFIPEHYYFRRIRKNSLMTSLNTLADIIPVLNDVIDIFLKKDLFLDYKELLFNKKISIIKLWFDSSEESYKDYFFTCILNEFKKMERDDKLYKLFKNELTSENLNFYNEIINSETYKEYSLNAEISKLKSENNQLKNNTETLKTENLQLKNNTETLKTENTTLKQKYENNLIEHEKLKKDIKEKNKLLEDLKIKTLQDKIIIDEKEEINLNLYSIIEDNKNKLEKNKITIAKLKSENNFFRKIKKD